MIILFTSFWNLLLGIIIILPQPVHLILISAPSLITSNSLFPHGCCFFISTILPKSKFSIILFSCRKVVMICRKLSKLLYNKNKYNIYVNLYSFLLYLQLSQQFTLPSRLNFYFLILIIKYYYLVLLFQSSDTVFLFQLHLGLSLFPFLTLFPSSIEIMVLIYQQLL